MPAVMRQPLFHHTQEPREDESKRQINKRHSEPNFKGPVIGRNYFLALPDKLAHADNHQQGSILKTDDELVAQRGDHTPKSLRPDNVTHGLKAR